MLCPMWWIGFDKKIIESFLNEFKTKYITGAVLLQLKNSEDMIDKLMQQFIKENQIFGIWFVVKNCIIQIDNDSIALKAA